MTGDLEKDTESLDSIIEKFEGSKGVKDSIYAIGLLIRESMTFAEKENLCNLLKKKFPE